MSDATGADQQPALSPSGRTVARRRRVLGSAYRLFYRDPVHLVRGEGVWLYDAQGQAYLDAYNNVACVGHSNPRVTAALSAQARVLNTNTRYLTDEAVDYAERLVATFSAPLSQVIFTCTGSEANDLAYRVAQAVTGGTGVIVTSNAYHGVTAATSSFSPSLGLDLPDHVRAIPAPSWRGGPGSAETFAADVRAAVRDLRACGVAPAALIVDTIFASDGVIASPVGLLGGAVEAVHDEGALFIADEVQAGFGRLGTGMWGFDRHGVTPDLVTLGKPMGNGHPLAGVVLSPRLGDRFAAQTRYFNTFGGNTVSCAVGLAVLDVIEDEGLVASAEVVGADLHRGLREIMRSHPAVVDVRGAGLYQGVQLRNRDAADPPGRYAGDVVEALRERHVLVGASGPDQDVIKIRPPLVFGKDHVATLLTSLDDVLTTRR